MSNNNLIFSDTISEIEALLTEGFKPTSLNVEDESYLHIGHKGAESGAGHYKVFITSPDLAALSRVKAHRLIYETLSSLMGPQIHALSIKIIPLHLPEAP